MINNSFCILSVNITYSKMFCQLIAAFALIGLVAGRVHMATTREEKFRLTLIRECAKYGGLDKLEEIETAITDFPRCINTVFDANIQSQFFMVRAFDDVESIVNVARSICTKKNALEICFFNLMDATLPCVDPDLRDRLNDSKKAIHELGDYICEDDAVIIGKLLEKDAMKCLESRDKCYQISQCMSDFESIDMSSLSPMKRCEEFNKTKNCLLDNLRQCPTHTHADFVETVLNTLAVGSHCEKKEIISDNTI